MATTCDRPLRRCVNLSPRLQNMLFHALHLQSGTHCAKPFSTVTVAVFKSRLKSFLFSKASLLPMLTNTLPGPSASEVTTLWCYTTLFIIIIITGCDVNVCRIGAGVDVQ